jgi:hypothetical protein
MTDIGIGIDGQPGSLSSPLRSWVQDHCENENSQVQDDHAAVVYLEDDDDESSGVELSDPVSKIYVQYDLPFR